MRLVRYRTKMYLLLYTTNFQPYVFILCQLLFKAAASVFLHSS